MRPALRQQNNAFIAAFALLLGAASAKDPFEAQTSAGRSACIQQLECYTDVVTASGDPGDANGPFYGCAIRDHLPHGKGHGARADISKAANRPMPVAIIDGHPHNPARLLVQDPSVVV